MSSNKFSIMAIANSMENDVGEFGTNQHMRYIRWLLEGYRELNFSRLREVKSIAVDLNSYNAVDLWQIDDYVDWTKVGVQHGDKLWLLSTAKDISLLHNEDDCGNKLLNPHRASQDDGPAGLSVDSFTPYYFYNVQWVWAFDRSDYDIDGNCGTSYYGAWPFDGAFKVNRETKQLQFASNFRHKTIYLEYISDGSSPCGETCVNPYVYDYLRQYGHWRRVEHDRNVSMGEKSMIKRSMYNALSIVEMRMADMTKEGIIDRFRKGIKLTPKI